MSGRTSMFEMFLAGVALAALPACSGDEAENADGDEPAASTRAPAVAAADTLELVGAGVISLPGRNETFPAEDPVTGDLWFSVYDDSFDDQTLMFARRSADSWAGAVMAPFSGTWGDRAARFSPDGSELYFTSNRPRASGGSSGDMNIWRVRRTDGGWSDPEIVAGAVNSPDADIHASATERAVWVASNRAGSLGRSDIFRIASDGTVAHLSAPINDERSQPDVLVGPDESWMILVVTDRPDGLGGDDLYLSNRASGEWSTPINVGAPLNSDAYEYGPTISADGRHLYFTSHRGDDANVYRVALAELLDAGP